MPDIKISISTEAELEAAKALEKQLERDIAKAKLLGENYDELAKKLERVKSSINSLSQAERDALPPAVANATATRNIGEEAGKAAEKKSRFLAAIKQATSAIPGLNAVVAAGINPWTLIAAAIATAWHQISKWKAEVEAMKERLQIFDDIKGRVGAFSEAIKQARIDQENFNREIDKQKNKPETPEEEAQILAARVGRRFGAKREILEAEKRLALARVDESEAKGLPATEANVRRRAVEASFAKRISDLDLAGRAEQAMVTRVAGQSAIGIAERTEGNLPRAQAELLEAGKAVQVEQERLQQAFAFAGIDAEGRVSRQRGESGRPLGRVAQIDDELEKVRYFSPQRARLLQERESLVSGITLRQSTLTELESRKAAAAARVAEMQGTITTSRQSGRALIRSASEMNADIASEFETRQAVAGIDARVDASRGNAELATAADNIAKSSANMETMFRNAAKSVGGAENALESYLQAEAAEKEALKKRIRQLEQRQQRDPP